MKGVHLEGLRVLGNPVDFANHYYEHGVDELIYMDVVASLYGRNSLSDLISRTARDLLVPLTVGGGLRTQDDIFATLRAGADKVCINSAAVRNPPFIAEAVARFGSSTIVVAIEAIKQRDGQWFAFIENGRERTGLEVIAWARQIAALGAGEILLTSVDREGTGKGFDADLIRKVSAAVPIPVIAHGGAGNAEHVVEAIQSSGADAVAAAALFHYETIRHLQQRVSSEEGNRDFLKSGQKVRSIDPVSIDQLKATLINSGIQVRP